MAHKRIGGQTVRFENPPSVLAYAAVAGKKEGEGPLSDQFDLVIEDAYYGEKTWEKAEVRMQQEALTRAAEKMGCVPSNFGYIFAGDLINQCLVSSFALRDAGAPVLGLYGACSTMVEALGLASLSVDGGFAECAAALTSSHFASSERQFRMPLEYGNQRTPTAQWTVTGSGVCVVGENGPGPYITHFTAGKIVDMGVTDAANMGAAMAPSAFETLTAFFMDTQTAPSDYDLIVTGDLGRVGFDLLLELFKQHNVQITNVNDCGLMIFDLQGQDVHAGGSGCGCSALVLNSKLLNEMKAGTLNKILVLGTGALLSPVSTQQGESIPGVSHLICISNTKG